MIAPPPPCDDRAVTDPSEAHSFKAGDFELQENKRAFNGEQLVITARTELKGRVCPGLGRIVTSCDRPSTSYQIREEIW